MSWTLEQYFAAEELIRRVYQEELGRDILGDPQALANWIYHLREYGHDEDWLRAQFRASEEYQRSHGGTPFPDPAPPPISPPAPPPPLGSPRVIRVTGDADGPFAPRMMSDRANAWVTGTQAVVFAGSRETGGPRFFQVDLPSGRVDPRASAIPYMGETEGWLWLPDGRLILPEGPRIRRVHPFQRSDDQIMLDISEDPQFARCDLWQPHASDDGQIVSATVRKIVSTGKYPHLGTIVRTKDRTIYFDAHGTLDESQLSRNGRWILIKETPARNNENDNDDRIINLETRETRVILDRNRALGHSDCGPNYAVGEADKPDPGACVVHYFDRPNESPQILFHTLDMGYVSTRNERWLHSGATYLSLIARDGSGLTPLIEHGGGSSYDDRVKANLDPSGQVATYMVGGSVYLLVLGG